MSSTQPGTLLGQRLIVVLLVGVAAMSLFAIQQGVTMGLAMPFGLVALTLLFIKPNIGTLLFIALAYMNAPVLLGRLVGSPQTVAMGVTALLGIPIAAHLVKRRGLVVDYTFLLMLVFLGSLFGSSFLAVDTRVAFAWVTTFLVEGVLLYFLLLNAIRDLRTLRAAIWTLILVSAFLSSLGLYQEVSGNHHAQFGGLAQRNTEREPDGETPASRRERTTVYVGDRAAGPMNGPNRFAQILIIVLPLAFFRIRDERSGLARLVALGCLLLILVGVFITYSRGTFLALVAMMMVMVALKYIPWWQMVFGGLLLGVIVTLAAPGFMERIDTMRTLPQLLTQRDTVEGHGAIRGRLTEMLAGIHVFMDYPVLGVGPGQYMLFYSQKYMANPEISFREINKGRRAHCLYAELAAETGLVGMCLFLAIVGTVLARLWRLRSSLQRTKPELANLAFALWLGLFGYLTTAVFLQLAYQRYFWLYLALAGAAVQLLENARRELAAQRSPTAI